MVDYGCGPGEGIQKGLFHALREIKWVPAVAGMMDYD